MGARLKVRTDDYNKVDRAVVEFACNREGSPIWEIDGDCLE